VGPESRDLGAWLTALQDRHRSSLTSAEFLKALRALSARYVERRSQLRDRSPLDSAGKRAAFAAFYAPLHFVTTQAVLRALAVARGGEAPALISARGPREDSESAPAAGVGVGPHAHESTPAGARGGATPRALIIDLGLRHRRRVGGLGAGAGGPAPPRRR